ncbi:MAG: acetate--CoA ligase family protein [Rubrivivax sp.]|nr:acetate--CoA ligase family protein [Rubrivivax sp.]
MAHPLDPLFRPRSVAIVGASSDPNKVGGRPLAFLQKGGYRGRILPVNPAAAEVQGVPAYPSLADVPGGIDQAIVAVAAAQVPAVAAECIARGARALQVFSSGFGVGAGAAEALQRLQRMARDAGVRILGPNSLGLFNTADGFFGTFATALDGAWPAAGGVGVATQSGAFGSYFFGLAQQRGLGFSHFVATGNELDVDVADCIDFLVHDAATQLIVVALEGCRDGRKLAAALHAARTAGKRVLAMKVGVSQAGAAAAATHTGSLAGEDRVFDAVLRETGAWRAGSLQALVEAAYAATVALPQAAPHTAGSQGRDLLVVTTSGGIGVLAADAAEAHGLALPGIGAAALQVVQAIAPLAAGENPVDTSAGILGDLSAYARIAGVALEARRYDAVLCYLAHIPRNPAHWAQLHAPLLALRQRHAATPFAAVGLADAAITADLEAHGVAVYADPTAAVRSLAALLPMAAHADPVGVAREAASATALEGPLATEADAKRALAARGIAFAPERRVHDADEAVAAAQAIGWPVVLKIVSPDIAHKTEAGGVALGLTDEAALRAALPAMRQRVAARLPHARLEGFLVARQLQGGVEVLVGTQRDPVFGPVVTVGAGGVLTELLGDVSVRLAPVSHATARAMLAETRVAALLRGWRGAPAADLDALAEQVARLSAIAWASRDTVAGLELNPVLARPEGAYALDALVVGAPAPTGEPA